MARVENPNPTMYSDYDFLKNNYIYLYHTDEFLPIPVFPDQIMDQMQSSFSQQNALSRTAPVFSYSNSGPRQIQVALSLHRDMLVGMNTVISISNVDIEVGDDYIDTMIKKLQAVALPRYKAENKEVVPPMVAVRFGDEVFIKGVVIGGVSVEYHAPIIQSLDGSGAKYAQVNIAFTVYEVDPYDAESVSQLGSFRGLTRTMTEEYNRRIGPAKRGF